MTGAAFCMFDTAIGVAAVAWRGEALVASWLPEASRGALEAAVRRRFPEGEQSEPPPAIARVIDAVERLLAGEAQDLGFAELDLDGVPAFEASVWLAARTIPPGETLTYGMLAARIGEPGAARAVGAALGRNRFPIVVPCHRILAATGTGGFSAPGGRDTKLRLLEIERAALPGEAPGLFGALPLRLAPERR
jgi:methylated-DNA-[protein]-cysteine S-methyltransferase